MSVHLLCTLPDISVLFVNVLNDEQIIWGIIYNNIGLIIMIL